LAEDGDPKKSSGRRRHRAACGSRGAGAAGPAIGGGRWAATRIQSGGATIGNRNLRDSKERFYNFFVKLLLKHDDDMLSGARVKIDGSGDREFKRELASYLRKQLSAGKIKSVKFTESHRDNLIQLADMTTGAIARSYRKDERKLAGRWRQMLAAKIQDVWEFR